MASFVLNISSSLIDDRSLRKQRELAQASKDYMEGRITLEQLRRSEKKNSFDYAAAALRLVGLGSCLSSPFRAFRPKA